MDDSLRRELVRHLRQEGEVAGVPILLEEMTGEEALGHARSALRGGERLPLRPVVAVSPVVSVVPVVPVATGLRASSLSAPSPRPSAAPPSLTELPRELEGLRAVASGCTLCALSRERTQVVFSDGNPNARLMVIGEAPGANEDRTGTPFVGAAGKLLDLLLATIDLDRTETAYIANVIKCRPPGNRNPLPEEIEACAPYLRGQIAAIRPRAILALGSFAAQWLTGSEAPLGKLRGVVHAFEGVPVVVTYHPAALLRNGSWTRPTWMDLQLLRGVMDASR